MHIMVLDPQHPRDKERDKPLSKEQLHVVHDYIVECINSGKRIKDGHIVDMLAKAGKPLHFESKV